MVGKYITEVNMLKYTRHPLVDVGVATITAFVNKRDPASLAEADLDKVADFMAREYVVDPLKSFLTVAFPNSGFTNPAFSKTPEKRHKYAELILRGYRADTPTTAERCVFTGKSAVGIAFSEKLPPGRAFRQHVPLLSGEESLISSRGEIRGCRCLVRPCLPFRRFQ